MASEYLPEFTTMPMANSERPEAKKMIDDGLSKSELSQLAYREIKGMIKSIKNSLIVNNLNHDLIYFFCTVHTIYNDLLQIRKNYKGGDKAFFESNEILFFVYYITVVRLLNEIKNSKINEEHKKNISTVAVNTLANIFDSKLYDAEVKNIKKTAIVDGLLRKVDKNILEDKALVSNDEAFNGFKAIMNPEKQSVFSKIFGPRPQPSPAAPPAATPAPASTATAPAAPPGSAPAASSAPSAAAAAATPAAAAAPATASAIAAAATPAADGKYPLILSIPANSYLGIKDYSKNQDEIEKFGCNYVITELVTDKNSEKYLYKTGIKVPFGVSKVNDTDVSKMKIREIEKSIQIAQSEDFELILIYLDENLQKESLEAINRATAAAAADAAAAAAAAAAANPKLQIAQADMISKSAAMDTAITTNNVISSDKKIELKRQEKIVEAKDAAWKSRDAFIKEWNTVNNLEHNQINNTMYIKEYWRVKHAAMSVEGMAAFNNIKDKVHWFGSRIKRDNAGNKAAAPAAATAPAAPPAPAVKESLDSAYQKLKAQIDANPQDKASLKLAKKEAWAAKTLFDKDYKSKITISHSYGNFKTDLSDTNASKQAYEYIINHVKYSYFKGAYGGSRKKSRSTSKKTRKH